METNDNPDNAARADSPAPNYYYYLSPPQLDSLSSRWTGWTLICMAGLELGGKHIRVTLLEACCPTSPPSGSLFQSHLRGKSPRMSSLPPHFQFCIFKRHSPDSFKGCMPACLPKSVCGREERRWKGREVGLGTQRSHLHSGAGLYGGVYPLSLI